MDSRKSIFCQYLQSQTQTSNKCNSNIFKIWYYQPPYFPLYFRDFSSTLFDFDFSIPLDTRSHDDNEDGDTNNPNDSHHSNDHRNDINNTNETYTNNNNEGKST